MIARIMAFEASTCFDAENTDHAQVPTPLACGTVFVDSGSFG